MVMALSEVLNLGVWKPDLKLEPGLLFLSQLRVGYW